jgi:hypothetical protein
MTNAAAQNAVMILDIEDIDALFASMDVIEDDMVDPSLDTAEGESLLLGVSRYS